ncbi:allantoinase AllB [Mycobacterium sp. URHB0044]|uniref:allantoinase AllB n=1 Tax=Mycobacterium sp. URHB0044 TaxID=1380386 RepID=UPI00048EB3CE|nr:allantoinase AllB [Mycobacterium sp. URHB0044]
MDLVLRAERTLIDGAIRPAAVGVVDGAIAAIMAIDADAVADQEVRVPSSAVLLPGFVDTHVHVNAPGTDWEGFATATTAAAAGGITTLVDMPLDSDPVTTTVAALVLKKAAAQGNCVVAVDFWAGVVPANVDDLDGLAAAGVRGFKCFLSDSGNPNFPHLSAAEFRDAAAHVARLGAVLLVHAEQHDVIADSPQPLGRGYPSFLASRPDAAEVEAVALVLETARETGARMHVVHVSSAGVLPMLAEAKRTRLPVTAETCPHYLTFAAETIPDGGTEFAACPPIRGEDNRRRLWDGLRQGTLDMVVSDHSPCAPELKADGDFGVAFGGISSLQLGPVAVWTQARGLGFDLPDLSRWMAEHPAALAGYGDRGRIAVGMRADLCVFDPDARHTVRADALFHRHAVTPYQGAAMRGSVLQTWLAGRRVFDSEQVRQPA